MKPGLRRALAWVGYAAFYFVALVVFVRVTFPFERVRERIVAEYNAQQPADGARLDIDDLSGYWLSGVEVEGARLLGPKPEPAEDGTTATRREVQITTAHVSVSLLRRLLGATHLSFGADAFGGTVEGVYTDDSGDRAIETQIAGIDIGQAPFLADVVGLPMSGATVGTFAFTLPEGKFAKAEGKLAVSISDLAVGDGKAKVLNAIALPRLTAGEVVIEATAEGGRLDLTKLEAKGSDLELVADGKIRLRDPIESSIAEINLRYKFSDAYRTKSDTTKAIFGDGTVPGLIELDPKSKRAKRTDGFYGWRVSGPLSKLDFQPSPTASAAGRGAKRPANLKGFGGR